MEEIKFANPEYLYLLILVPFLILWQIFKRNRLKPELNISSLELYSHSKSTIKQKLKHIPKVFRILSICLLIIAVARPQSTSTRKSINTEGIDIVLSLDISSSMNAMDFKPNRLEAAKKNAIKFIESRVNDRIGLVVFAGESYTQCPVTIDHDVLVNLLGSIKIGVIKDGTAIGMGLGTAITRLQDSKAKSKVIILLTDGVNNSGSIPPETASEMAKSFGIKVYTIGVGSKGTALMPYETPYGTRTQEIKVNIDEELLNTIAKNTGGEYFRATGDKALEKIYKQIDEMEKTKVDVAYFNQFTEEFLPLVFAAGLLLLLELILNYTYFRSLP